MLRARTVILFTVLIGSIVAGYLLVKRTESPAGDMTDKASHQARTSDVIAEWPEYSEPAGSDDDLEELLGSQDDALACITPAQLESDPLLAAEYARLDSVITSGPTIASYRGLSSAQLSNLAVQGDSAAMAVLGAVAVMRARNLPETKAVEYLLREDPTVWSFSLERPLEPDVLQHLEAASSWFYKSALHGRVLALQNAGQVIAMVAESPTQLGWIEEDIYEELSGRERYTLDPATVYEALAFELAPQLRSGPFGQANADLTLGGERQRAVLDQLVRQFNDDREAARLPPVELPESQAPSMEELEAMLCKP